MSEVQTWSTTSANNNSTPPDGWPEGMQYSQVNNSARENMGAIARLYADMNGTLTSGGYANAYTLTPNRTIASYVNGLSFQFKANFTNTAAATLNVSALGAKTILDCSGTALVSGSMQSGFYYTVRYDGTNFILLQIYVINSVASTNTNQPGSANAVKTAYDAAQTGITNAAAASAAVTTLDGLALHKAGSETITGVKTYQGGAEPIAKNITKIWCLFNGLATGTFAPNSGHNVTSITRNGVGDYTVNFAITLSSANYACIPSVGYASNPGCWAVIARNATATPLTTTSARLITTVSGGNVDADLVCVEILCAN